MQEPTHTPEPGATITQVRRPDAGSALSQTNIVIANLAGLVSVAGMLLGIGLASLFGMLLTNPDLVPFGKVGFVLAIVALLICLLLAFVSAVIGLGFSGYFGNLWLRWAICRIIRRRPDAVVRPDEDGAEFIEVVPRANLNALMPETATDIGFLRIDMQQGALLFEGDKERIIVPAGAILFCGQEAIGGLNTHHLVKYDYITLHIKLPSSAREWIFSRRVTSGFIGAKARRNRTERLRAQIEALAAAARSSPAAG